MVFDNLAAHLKPAVTEAIERAGASVLPLPPYSPDFNPIEQMFSKVKEFLRRVAARTKGNLYPGFLTLFSRGWIAGPLGGSTFMIHPSLGVDLPRNAVCSRFEHVEGGAISFSAVDGPARRAP